ncbi:hypothetical protein [Epilithonimonas xixisoli]|uniref:hypothetical protein n=1 Tax=Epilithonimonas xixisoli TaxID=1476462 RepID=UPI0010631A20|nr:hypothetical protein [Epilithonimonas xixisoli]
MYKVFLILLLFGISSCNKKTDFDKIIYNYYGGFDGPIYNLELKNNKNFILKRDLVLIDGTSPFDFQYDSTKIGYFGGKITNEHFDQIKLGLTKILKKNYKYNDPEFTTDIPHLNLTIITSNDTIYIHTLNVTENFTNDILVYLNRIGELDSLKTIKPFNTKEKN